MNRRERRTAGRGSQSKQARAGADTPTALYQAGLRHREAGRNLDAQICCRRALAIDPDHADTLHLMGVLSLDAKQYDHALEWITRAVTRDSRPEYLSSLGTALHRQGRYQDALIAFDQAVQLKPGDPDLWKSRGNVLIDLKRPADAVESFQQTLKFYPRDWDATYRCGFLLHELGRLSDALVYFDLVDRLRPNQAVILEQRAAVLHKLKRFDEALADNRRAHALNPRNAAICNNIGAALQVLRRDEEALPWFDEAAKLRPDFIDAWINKAASLQQLHRFDEAAATYHHAKTVDPGNAEPDWGLALLQLLTGNFEDGWALREARWNRAHTVAYPKFAQPKWRGEADIAGKTILIHVDEGLGDTIQFVRYVPAMAARGARVILVVLDAVYPLLSKLPGVTQCLPYSAAGTLPAFDMHCPISSLPLGFGTRLDTIPSALSYLPPPPEARMRAWEDRLGPHDKLRVGLVWAGNPGHQNDHNRSTSLRTMSRLLDIDATFVSLQKDPRPDDQAVLRERNDLVDLTADLTDFSETAALVSCLDLVITVDTSVAHLAAALGRPTWVLLPYTPDYRWLLDRDDSPWYPSVRLFRQSVRRDYAEVLDRVRGQLLTLIAEQQAVDRTSSANPTTPAALYEAGLDHRRAGRHREAQLYCQQALAADSSHAGALHLMGLLSLDAGQHDQALDWIARAIRQDPKPEYLASLGVTLQRQGWHEEALSVFDKAVQLRPVDAGLWKYLAGALMELQRPGDALLSLQHALKLDPRDWDAAYKSLFLLHALGRFEEALAHFDQYEELQPDHVPALQLRALSLRGLGRFEEALADNQRAIALEPDNADTCNNLGDALQSLERREEALQWFDRAIELRPSLIQALKNKAFVLTQLHRFDEAVAVYRRVLLLDPANAAAECDLAQLQLLRGDFEAGWTGREARWKLASTTYPKFAQPMWLGKEAVEGKTILVYADEGIGDSIQFARYIPALAARGARVILAVEAPACPLLSELAGVSQCIAKPLHEPPAFDMHCPMCSLPLAFGTRLDTIPSGISYLPRPREDRVQAWEYRLGPRDKLRIGLVWSGNPNHGNDRNRSLPLRLLTRILDANATFVSLQRDPRPEDQAVLRERTDIVDLTAHLTDFRETAALVSCLDLVITVDTSVAHLSAALGCPTWILLPYTPDYRWLLDRDDSPWYPAARLFRQSETREYASVLDSVRSELEALISARAAGDTPTALHKAGLGHRQAGRPLDAQLCRQQALAIDAAHADSLHLMGLLSLDAGQYDRAVQWIARAVKQEIKGEYLFSLGMALRQHGRLDEALLAFQHALKLEPDHWDAAQEAGALLYQAGRLQDALGYLQPCLEQRPDHAPTLVMCTACMFSLRKFEEVAVINQRAHALDPGNADPCNSVGVALQFLGRQEEALPWFDRAIGLRPDFVDALNNKAVALAGIHRFDEACAAYDRVREIDPANVGAEWNLALLQMLTGKFAAGWAGREARWKSDRQSSYPKFSQPRWFGEADIEGKTILVCADEGLGDTIQFARYVPQLAARGARVILAVEESARVLLSGLAGVSQCVRKSANGLPAFDLHCPMSGLPLAFGTRLDTIPSDVPYLPVPPEHLVQVWQDRLGRRDKLRVGLVWSGNPQHGNDHNRSIPLRTLLPLLDADAMFVSLQKDPRPADQAVLREHNAIVDLTAHLTDFVETAALIDCLDLVITVDTSVAHLAAALGRPTWILLPYTPDYRWLLDRDDSPWYPTARLFRQTETREYASVLNRAATELKSLITARSSAR